MKIPKRKNMRALPKEIPILPQLMEFDKNISLQAVIRYVRGLRIR
jgi:hypothetical protein